MSSRIVTNQNTGVVCRSCDSPMQFEEENPRGYFLFKCGTCGSRVGLSGQRFDEVLLGLLPQGELRTHDRGKTRRSLPG